MGSSQPQVRVTWAQAFRDIFLAAINKGQFFTALLGLFFLVVAWRLPVADLSVFVKTIIDSLISGSLLGYGLAVAMLVGWAYHAKRMRRLASNEQKRIGNEKTELQKIGLGKKVKSSK